MRAKKHLDQAAETVKIDYKATITGSKFHKSDAFVRGIKGPIGSGKSVACCMEILYRAMRQEKADDGLRHSRWLIVRNTLPQLETTTMKTWKDWFPERIFGRISGRPPYTQQFRISDVELEVIFIALDRPEDVKKLLSFECSGIWFNEAREIELSLLDAATGRVGRYPGPKQGSACTWSGVIMDTNPPDDSHWWYNFSEEKTPKDWEFFNQPSGLDDNAENLENLLQPKGFEKMPIDKRRKHGRVYYERMLSGKTQEWIDVYVHGKYGFIQDGKPVYGTNWNDDVHTSKKSLEYIERAPLYVGLDFGLTPAAVFAQRSSRGQWRLLDEIVTDDMDIPTFAKMVKTYITINYPGSPLHLYGDPSGGFREADGRSAFDMMRAAGLAVRPGPTNKFEPRKDSVIQPLIRMIDGQPGLLVDKKCKMLRRGFNGGYKYRRLSVSGDAKHTSEPDKNKFSHVHDALQYLLSGGGEYKSMLGRNSDMRTVINNQNWSIWT